MKVAEIIEQQRRACEADRIARQQRRPNMKPSAPAPQQKPMTPADRHRAFIEDRTYDGKAPEGDMTRILRKESPDEYVARDGTRTFVPWRYVSMQELELPNNGNPYRKPNEEETNKRLTDPWGRPSGYVGSAAGFDMSPEYDPWSASGTPTATVPASQGTQNGWDEWLSPAPAQPAPQQAASRQQWDSWMAPPSEAPPPPPPPPASEPSQVVDTEGTLDIMRSMRP